MSTKDPHEVYKNILAVGLVGELTMLLDRIELHASGERRESLVDERLNLKRARAQLTKIINDLEPEIIRTNEPKPMFRLPK